MPPDKVVELLNHYLDLQASLIAANEGDVDKYVGDEMMAQFDGPRKEINACKAGLEIRRAMARRGAKATDAKGTVISIGIGINTGTVVHGSVGAKDRMDFTSIGDTVNLAARLEGANKQYGTGSLITEAVYDKVENTYLCREVDLLTVKGKSLPVRIFEIIRKRRVPPNGTSTSRNCSRRPSPCTESRSGNPPRRDSAPWRRSSATRPARCSSSALRCSARIRRPRSGTASST